MSKRFVIGLDKAKSIGSSSSKELNKVTPSLWDRWLSRKKEHKIVLSEVVDIEHDFQNFSQGKLKNIRPEILYEKGSWTSTSQLVTKCEENLVQVGDNEDKTLSFISEKEIARLQKRNGAVIAHIGMLIVGVKGMTKQEFGAKTLLMIYDESVTDPEKKIIVYMEVDMNKNRGLFYCAPNIIFPLEHLHRIKVGIQTKGYGNIQRENLVIVTGFLGKTAASSNILYKCNVKGVVESIASKGVRFIQAEPISSDLYKATPWPLERILEPEEVVSQPTKGKMYKDSKGKLKVVFSDYEESSLHQEEEGTI